MKVLSRIYTVFIFILLYSPIAVMVFFSFNSGSSLSVFDGFSLRWYNSLFSDSTTLNALKNTIILALVSSAIATLIGTAAAVGISKIRNKFFKSTVTSVTKLPMVNPDIVTGISLLLMFVAIQNLFRNVFANPNIEIMGFWTILIAHVTFNIPYVTLSVLPKISQMDKHLPEAAMDLGCTPFMSFMKVELPALMPGVLTGALMAFTLSLDDFVISYFAAGTTFTTLPLKIYTMTRGKVKPDLYALSTIIFISILVLLILINVMGSKNNKNNVSKRRT